MYKLLIYGVIFSVLLEITNAESIHANKICFNMSIIPLEFRGGSITTGQPYNTCIYQSDNNSCIVIHAGRELSSIPKEWVKNSMKSESISWDPGNMTANKPFSGNMPLGLNFAVKLDILVNNTYECDDLILGQGSDGMGINDWWVFSNNNFQNHTISCMDINITLPAKIKLSNLLTDNFKLTVLKN